MVNKIRHVQYVNIFDRESNFYEDTSWGVIDFPVKININKKPANILFIRICFLIHCQIQCNIKKKMS